MRRKFSQYHPSYPGNLVYMLQSVLYDPTDFFSWWLRVKDFRRVQHRRTLVKTTVATMLLYISWFVAIAVLAVCLLAFLSFYHTDNVVHGLVGLVLLLTYPLLLALVLALPLHLAKRLIKDPRDKKALKRAAKIYAAHPGTVIAVAGSYGKTTAKEILKSVLEEGGKTAATVGNMNVPVSLAKFASRLSGDEKFVIVEFGEGYRGDVARMTKLTDPDIGIVTGLAPNHLDEYKTLENLADDLLSLPKYLKFQNSFVAGDNEQLRARAKNGEIIFDMNGLDGWQTSSIRNDITGLSFVLKKGSKTLNLKSGLVGRHQVAPLALAAVLADRLGMTKSQIEKGIGNTRPFEHRMQPRSLHGAWVIDDTYNGNLEGIRVGLALLSELKTKGRKIYVTPGLVDQGKETDKIHLELGRMIADAKPDEVVLMQNSTTEMIQHGLGDFDGIVKLVNDPLEYYKNLDLTLAAGDIAMLQNDWTDNYN